VLTDFGNQKGCYWNIMKRGVQQWTVLGTVRCSVTSQSLRFEANEEDCCQKALCCCTTMPILTLLPILWKLNFDVSKHPPCSPDLVPSDCHLFGPLQQALRGRRFITDQQLKATVHLWLVCQPKTLYFADTKKTGQRWTKCIEKQGGCVEKWCACEICALVLINVKHTLRLIIDWASYFCSTAMYLSHWL
jgi:hypothetical protein